MATNVFFSQKVRSEQNLYEDIIIESLKMFGQDVYYLPREIALRDDILNEDVESNFTSSYVVEMYIENQEGFDGDGSLLSKFGVEIRDQATFVVSKRRWEQLISIFNNGINSQRPNEGDLIYLPLSKSIFEIRFVEHESPFYQLSNLPVYKLQCELFEYSGETIDTGISSLDTIINRNISAQLVLTIEQEGEIELILGETIQQEIGSTGEYVQARIVNIEVIESTPALIKKISLTDWITTNGEYHEFNDSATIEGITSGAVCDVTDVYNIDDTLDKQAFGNDNQAQNQEFENSIDSIVDFSESNPFGDF